MAESHTVGGPTFSYSIPPAPSVECPKCFAILVVTDDWCWRCERTFAGGELWALYETGSR